MTLDEAEIVLPGLSRHARQLADERVMRERRLMQFLRLYPNTTVKQLAEITGRAAPTLNRQLCELEQRGVAQRTRIAGSAGGSITLWSIKEIGEKHD